MISSLSNLCVPITKSTLPSLIFSTVSLNFLGVIKRLTKLIFMGNDLKRSNAFW